MKYAIFCLVLAVFITSCASLHHPSSILYQEFSRYEDSVDERNVLDVANEFFTRSLLGSTYQSNPDAVGQLLFKDYMAKKHSHFEKIKNQEGCLTINGYDDQDAPLIFSLKYVSSNERWLIDKIHIVLIEDRSGFSKSAKCPSEYSS